ncbi:hypothetical protein ATR1_380c0001, partial [Acetobacter tropicalis]
QYPLRTAASRPHHQFSVKINRQSLC